MKGQVSSPLTSGENAKGQGCVGGERAVDRKRVVLVKNKKLGRGGRG